MTSEPGNASLDVQARSRERRTEERLALALGAARLGAWEFDLRSRRLTSSPQCKANHGFGPDADMQLEPDIVEAIPESHRGEFLQAIAHAIDTGTAFEIEVPNVWPDGSNHWLLVAGRVVDPTCMVGVSQDITDRRRIEQALRDSDRRKDEFLAVLAHELRGPLAPILMAVKLLQAKGPNDPELQRLRDTIYRQTLQLSTLVEDLLDVGRITAGKLRLEMRRVDLREVARQAVEMSAATIERRRHTLRMQLPDQPVPLHGDLGRLVQVAGNLVSNAAKYSPEGRHIDVVVFEEAGMGVLLVRDQGIGIPPEMLDRIFDRFVQVQPGTSGPRSESGLGIGLSVVKALVDLHGGRVEARSAGVGRGSEFAFRLPVVSAPVST